VPQVPERRAAAPFYTGVPKRGLEPKALFFILSPPPFYVFIRLRPHKLTSETQALNASSSSSSESGIGDATLRVRPILRETRNEPKKKHAQAPKLQD
jgi:hypothetical protein